MNNPRMNIYNLTLNEVIELKRKSYDECSLIANAFKLGFERGNDLKKFNSFNLAPSDEKVEKIYDEILVNNDNEAYLDKALDEFYKLTGFNQDDEELYTKLVNLGAKCEKYAFIKGFEIYKAMCYEDIAKEVEQLYNKVKEVVDFSKQA